jgi:hypothetical protein
VTEEEPSEKPLDKHGRLSAYLLACVAFRDEVDLAAREDLVGEMVILAHHDLVCGSLAPGQDLSLFTHCSS